jgi:hypothetical protein
MRKPRVPDRRAHGAQSEQDEISFDVWHLKKGRFEVSQNVHNRLARWKSRTWS